MRFLGSLIALAGLYLVVYDLLPIVAQYPLISHFPVFLQRLAGAAAIVIGLLLRLRRRSSGDDISDHRIRDELKRRDFTFIALERGWQADGSWNKVAVSVRRQSDYQASRFGRPWIISVQIPGSPREPWPFTPEQGKIVETRAEGFSVVISDCTYEGQQGRFAERMDRLIEQRK
jgi:hypothetical protein